MAKFLATCVFIMTATASYAADTFPPDGITTLCERDAPADASLCWAREVGFKGDLERKWTTIPEEYRASCISEQARDFAVYYSKLAVCIAGKYKAAK